MGTVWAISLDRGGDGFVGVSVPSSGANRITGCCASRTT
jgi:hypothetical protein